MPEGFLSLVGRAHPTLTDISPCSLARQTDRDVYVLTERRQERPQTIKFVPQKTLFLCPYPTELGFVAQKRPGLPDVSALTDGELAPPLHFWQDLAMNWIHSHNSTSSSPN